MAENELPEKKSGIRKILNLLVFNILRKSNSHNDDSIENCRI